MKGILVVKESKKVLGFYKAVMKLEDGTEIAYNEHRDHVKVGDMFSVNKFMGMWKMDLIKA